WRPSSTGHLVERTIGGARRHVWRRERKMQAGDVRVSGREVWVLHPNGEPLPANAEPGRVQVLLVDGAWREAPMMAREILAGRRAWCALRAGGCGCCIRTANRGRRTRSPGGCKSCWSMAPGVRRQ